ncbi:MAG: hypothetical protein Q8P08_02405, partial [bacterium]|nr:hypothetical protein [bacterium]
GKNWEEVAEVEERIAGITVSPQGLYVFCQPYIYFSPFPLRVDSQWEKIDIEGDWIGSKLAESGRERNLLLLWDYSEILVFTHRILEKESEVVSPEPTRPEPVKSEPAEPKPVEPEPTEIEPATPEPATPEPPKIVLVKPETIESPPAEEILPPQSAPEKSGKGWLITLIVIAVIEALVVVVLIIRERRFYI